MNTLSRKYFIIAAILLVGIAIGVHQQRKISAAQRTLEATRARIAEMTNLVAGASEELQSLQNQLRTTRTMRNEVVASVAKVEHEMAAVDPESRWVEVPRQLPEWNSDSPYIWVRKDVVEKISAELFRQDGGLEEQVATVLAVDKQKVKTLNVQLTRILGEYRKLEAATAKLTDDHLPINRPKDAKVVTVTWERPAEGPTFKAEFDSALREALGEQRAKLLMEIDSQINNQFGKGSASTNVPKITVSRQKDGYINISVRQGSNWLSTGMPKDYKQGLNQYIPPHLQSYFAELIK